jgi:hypothetical protein
MTHSNAMSLPSRKGVALFFAFLLGALGLWLGGRSALSRARHLSSTADTARPIELHVPFVRDAIVIDAETDGKTVWESETGSTGNLKDPNGNGMVPYTEVKARWGRDRLYFLMYAGDLDLEGTVREPDARLSGDDSFHLEIGTDGAVHVVDVSVLGTISDAVCSGSARSLRGIGDPECDARWQSRAVVAVDRDGTLNHLGDNDEEWVVEMAIPLETLGLKDAAPGTRVSFAVRRCEIAKDGPRACGSWGTGPKHGELVLNPG